MRPARFILSGLLIALINALVPLLTGGNFMGLVDYAPGLDFANLKLTTTIVFEIAIAVTVFGAVSLIMEAIAHPLQVPFPTEDRKPLTSEIPAVRSRPETEPEQA